MTDVSKRNREQATGTKGRFATETRSTADVVLPPAAQNRPAALVRRNELQEQIRSLEAQASVESARALGESVRESFPDARYIVMTADDEACSNARIDTILDVSLNPLAKAHAPEHPAAHKAYWNFVDREAAPGESQTELAAALGAHQGKLDGCLHQTNKAPAFGVNAGGCNFTMDLDSLGGLK